MLRARRSWFRMCLWAFTALGLLGAVPTAVPDTVITSQPPSFTNSTSATFSFTSTEPGASFECKLDTSAFTACPSPITYLSLPAGGHSFEVRAKDAAGNTDPSPASYTWTVDRTAPETFINGPPPNPSNSTSASFAFSSNETTVSFECKLDTAAFAPCTSPTDFTGLAASSSHNFQVRARDAAGNVDASPASYTWFVDTTAPNTFISAQPPNSPNATISFSSNEAPVTFECKLDAAPFISCTSPVTLSGLSDGSHTFQVRARDAAGNLDPTPASTTWTVDTTAPDTTITGQPLNPSNSTSATFTFSANDSTASFECMLDTGTFAACTSPISYSNLEEDSHTFSVRARDPAGNVETTPASYTWVVDLTAPDTLITSAPPNPSSSSSATFTFAADKAGASFECKLDAAFFTACTSPTTYSALVEGVHTFAVRAIDAAGNTDTSPASYTWIVDTVAPDTFITSPPPDSPDDTITFTSNETPVTFECTLDAAAFAPCTSPVMLPALADSSHTFQVRATDAAGNRDPTPASISWTVDTAAPDTAITSQPSNPSNSTSATFTFTATEAGASFECKLDTGLFIPCTSPKTYSALADGIHTFQVRAMDAAGNVDAAPANYTWVVDTAAPDTTLTSQPPNPTNSTTATFSFTSNDATASFECKLDAAAFTACTSPKTYSALAEGSHTFIVRARDASGNVDASPASYTWIVDTVAPDTFITSPPPRSPGDTITFSSNETPVTFRCELDSTPFASCTSPVTPPPALTEGVHTFAVSAIDAGGNMDPTPATITWVVDVTPPDTTITSQPPIGTRETTARFTFSSEGGSAFECSLDQAPFEACTSPKDYTQLSEGDHFFQVRARDTAGNVDPTPASHAWTVDLTAPDTTLVQRPANPSYTASATFSFTSNESPSTFECRRDDAPAFTPCTSPVAYTGLTEGLHIIRVRAVDAAGNADPTPASFSWIVNARPPEAPIIQFPAHGARITQRQPPISGTAQPGSTVAVQLDGAALGTTTADILGQWTITPSSRLREGPHIVTATASDGAGTSDPSDPVLFTLHSHGRPPDDDPGHGCGCGSGSADASLLLWGLGLLAALGARRRARSLNRP